MLKFSVIFSIRTKQNAKLKYLSIVNKLKILNDVNNDVKKQILLKTMVFRQVLLQPHWWNIFKQVQELNRLSSVVENQWKCVCMKNI